MHKSWNISYSYTSDGSKVSEVVHKSHNDGETIYNDGYSRIQDNNLKEKFYKIKKNKDGKKTLLGKSKNKEEWQLMGECNGKKTHDTKNYIDLSSRFINNPSLEHRLDKNKQQLVNYNDNNELENMFNKMKLNMFDDDFFKF